MHGQIFRDKFKNVKYKRIQLMINQPAIFLFPGSIFKTTLEIFSSHFVFLHALV